MIAAEVSALQCSEEAVPQTDEPTHSADMDTLHEGYYVRVAAQMVAELMQGAQTLLSLADEVGVVLEGAEADRIVQMTDGNAILPQLLAP